MYKKKILRIISTINLVSGGPAQALIHSNQDLVNNGMKVDIITSDVNNSNYFKNKNIKIFKFGSPSFVGCFIFNINLFFFLLKNKSNYSHVLVHGIWGFKSTICRFLIKRYMVFVHGSLHKSEAKKGFFKNLKKKIYWNLLEKKNLIKSQFVILTSELEKKNFKNTFVKTKNIKTKFIKYGILEKKNNLSKAVKLFNIKFPSIKQNAFYLYLGRIHSQKGCDILIKSMKNTKKKLLIMGNFNDLNYENYLKSIISKNKIKNIIISKPQYGLVKWGALKCCIAFVSSTHGENFGISIVEAMSFGKPVIITNKVNIYKKIKNFNAGIISSDNLNSFSNSIKKFEKLNKTNVKKMGLNSYKCFKENFDLNESNVTLAHYLKKIN